MNKRRDFLKWTGMAGLGMAGAGMMQGFASPLSGQPDANPHTGHSETRSNTDQWLSEEAALSVIGLYGPWAAGLMENKLPLFSFRRNTWTNLEEWRAIAKKRLEERLAIPDIGGIPKVTINKEFEY